MYIYIYNTQIAYKSAHFYLAYSLFTTDNRYLKMLYFRNNYAIT